MVKTSSKVFIFNGKAKKTSEFSEEKEGKTIYEVIRIIDGKPLFIEQHYERMKYSFKLSGLEIEISQNEMIKQINTLVKENKASEGNIRITYNSESKNLCIYFIKHKYPTKKMYEQGVETILFFGERENPNAKIQNDDFRQKVNEKLEEREAYEAILVNRNGLVTEGSKSNIFMIKDGILYTPEVKDVLPGITRIEIISMAIELNVKVVEQDINYLGINQMDAMFISGTSPKILPINSVEDVELDVNNDTLRKMMDAFDKRIDTYIKKASKKV